jgi:uncharacterized repeat protein (TIGR01451 family)
VNKAITLTGSCTVSGWTCDPDVFSPTYLDGEGSRRAMYIVGTGGPVVLDGFRLRNGSASGNGGGIRVAGTAGNIVAVKLTRNQIYSNTVPTANGGGLYLLYADATLDGNWIYNNTASSLGGGMYASTTDLHMMNNVLAGNQAGNQGGGVYLDSPISSSASMAHNTIADNGQEGVRAYRNFAVTMVNTIVSGHTSYGIYKGHGSSEIVLNRTLWYGNASDGFDIVDNDPVPSGDPRFRDPSAWDYHIHPNSAAFNTGIDAGVVTDIDGEPRPMGLGYDVGADEMRVSLSVVKDAYPATAEPGDNLTYSIYVTNTGYLTLNATIVDTLPPEVTTSDQTSWSSVGIDPDEVWMETIAVTVNPGVSGIITNVVQVTTDEGAAGMWAETVMVTDTPDITVAPLSFDVSLNPDSTTARVLAIGNVGRANLTWSLAEIPAVGWLDEVPAGGSVVPLDTANVDVAFTAPSAEGVYNTTLRITSNDPDESPFDVPVILTVTTECIPASGASFEFAPQAPFIGTTVVLTGSVLEGSEPLVYTWDFGDGSGDVGQNVSHSYGSAMTYTVVMTATNDCGADSTSRQVVVSQAAYDIYLPVVMRNH